MQSRSGVLSIDYLPSNFKPQVIVSGVHVTVRAALLVRQPCRRVVLITLPDIMKLSHLASLAPSFYISRIFGLTPLLARKNRDGSLEFVAHRTLRVITFLSTIGMTCVSVFINIDQMPRILSGKTRYISYSACIVASCYGSVIVLGTALSYHGHTRRAFNEVNKLSHQLTRHLDHRKLHPEAFFLPITVVFMTIRYLLQVSRSSAIVLLTTYQYSYLVSLCSESLAAGFLFHLESFFKCFNAELSEIKLSSKLTGSEMEKWFIIRRLRHLRKVHNRIHDLCDIVCERFSLDLLVIFGIIILLILTALYTGIWNKTGTFMSLTNVMNLSHWVILVFRLVHICYRSDCVMKQKNSPIHYVNNIDYFDIVFATESEATSGHVQSLMTTGLPAEIRQEIYHFTLQTMLRKVEITASGFYGLRMETIATLFYLVTTSLVMVINLFENV